MSISQIKKQLLDYDFFKDWTIKKQTDSSLSIESPTSFIKEISTLTKQNNKYILSIDIPKNMLDTSELNHYKNTLQLLNSSNATCSFKNYYARYNYFQQCWQISTKCSNN